MWLSVHLCLFQMSWSMFLPRIDKIGWHLIKLWQIEKGWRFFETQCIPIDGNLIESADKFVYLGMQSLFFGWLLPFTFLTFFYIFLTFFYICAFTSSILCESGFRLCEQWRRGKCWRLSFAWRHCQWFRAVISPTVYHAAVLIGHVTGFAVRSVPLSVCLSVSCAVRAAESKKT